ncbi:MAG: hypothetical protein ACKO85_06740 [Isosphaeraceae bacterium]
MTAEPVKPVQSAELAEMPVKLPELPTARTLHESESKPEPVKEIAQPTEVKASVEVEKPVKEATEPAASPEPVALPELPNAEKSSDTELPALPELPKAETSPLAAPAALPELPARVTHEPELKAGQSTQSKSDDKAVTTSTEQVEAALPAKSGEKTVNGVPVLTPLPDDDSLPLPELPAKPQSPIAEEAKVAEAAKSELPPLPANENPASKPVQTEATAEPTLPPLPVAKPADEAMPPLPVAMPAEEPMPPLPVKEEAPALPELPKTEAAPATVPADTPPLPTQVKEEEPVKVAQNRPEVSAPPTGELPPLPAEEVAGSAGLAAAATSGDTDGEKSANRLLSGLSPERRRQIEEIARAQVERPGGSTPGLSPLGGGSFDAPTTQINNRGMLPGGGSISAMDDPLVRLELPRAPSPAEARPIRAILLPEQFDNIKPRQFDPRRKMWASSAVAHYPLYFQDPSLERYGISIEQRMGRAGRKLTYPIDDPTQSKLRNQIATPFFSAGLFALQTATWPLRMVADPPWEAEYDLGYYRPGDRVPEDTVVVPWKGVGPLFKGNKY